MSEVHQERKCSRCKRMLPRDAFASNTSMPDGLQAYCRECSAEYYRQRQEAKGLSVRQKVAVPPGHKRCPRCTEIKPHAQWSRNSGAFDGLATYCKACRAVEGRARHLMRQYGITVAERDELIASQAGMCPICLAASAEHVDHCHETGRVRGVLCFNCNSALGKLRDEPDALRRAVAYLEGNVWKPTLVAQGVYRLPS
ncbi:endonuclease VII domain-containing protein [Streptomyces sp. RKAG337]|nr:endonuclease VII domain-containing protein [Streptomyces sp. RKAG337]